MSIQQNINQTLSLASFVAGQTPMAAKKREAEVAKQAEARKAQQIALDEAAESKRITDKFKGVSERYAGHKVQGDYLAKRRAGSMMSEMELRAAKRATEEYVAAAEEYGSWFGARTPLEGQPTTEDVEALAYEAEDTYGDYEFGYKEAQAAASERTRQAQQAEADREAARQLEAERLAGVRAKIYIPERYGGKR